MSKKITDRQGADLEAAAWFIMENISGTGNPLPYDATAEWVANYVLRNAGDESIHAMWTEFEGHIRCEQSEARAGAKSVDG